MYVRSGKFTSVEIRHQQTRSMIAISLEAHAVEEQHTQVATVRNLQIFIKEGRDCVGTCVVVQLVREWHRKFTSRVSNLTSLTLWIGLALMMKWNE